MKDKLHEQLSALVDDELDTDEQAFLVRRLVTDEDLQRQFARYRIISDALKDELPDRVDPDFHLRIQAALHAEGIPRVVPAAARPGALAKPLAGLAVAASIAVVAVLSLQSLREPAPQSVPAIASAPAAQDYIRVEGRTAPVRPARNLDAYLVNHNEFAVNRGMQGMLPYARIVGQGEQVRDNEGAE